jgi:hypothetical protein
MFDISKVDRYGEGYQFFFQAQDPILPNTIFKILQIIVRFCYKYL